MKIHDIFGTRRTKLIKLTRFCQAQPKLQVKLSLKAELALFPLDPATHPAFL